MTTSTIAFDNSYARDLPGFYASCGPTPVEAPKLVVFNEPLAEALGLGRAFADRQQAARALSGVEIPAGASPIAQAYAGHQFGGFSPQLGDGRAILLGEIIAPDGARYDLQLKGSGPTPFARRGDGRAALGPMLREYLISEAMAALGIPTTRSLAVVATGEPVYRQTALPGAVLTRVAASHIRVGTFQFFAARGEADRVRQLADYTIARHYPEAAAAPNPYLAFLESVCARQAALVARWLQVGFIHGVMNTDNVVISGETIDYGPCAFMDNYDPSTVYSSIDEQGRYAYGNQPALMGWNLSRFAETLLPLIDADETRAIASATEVLEGFGGLFARNWLAGMLSKIGIIDQTSADRPLVDDLLTAMQEGQADFSLTFRALAQYLRGEAAALPQSQRIAAWLIRWRARIAGQNAVATASAMDAVNPLYIPRNHHVEDVLLAAEMGDISPFTELLQVLKTPFTPQAGADAFAQARPEGLPRYRTFCGT